jgi:hypothetical protein
LIVRKETVKGKLAIAAALFSSPFLLRGPASAKQCFSIFRGDDTVEVNTSVGSTKPLNGREFGTDETDCGLPAFPIIGSAFKSHNGDIIFTFRSMIVSVPDDCGAVDFEVTLSGQPLTGLAQLRNDHNNFTNTTTMTQVACPKSLPGAEPSGTRSNGPDNQGN